MMQLPRGIILGLISSPLTLNQTFVRKKVHQILLASFPCILLPWGWHLLLRTCCLTSHFSYMFCPLSSHPRDPCLLGPSSLHYCVDGLREGHTTCPYL